MGLTAIETHSMTTRNQVVHPSLKGDDDFSAENKIRWNKSATCAHTGSYDDKQFTLQSVFFPSEPTFFYCFDCTTESPVSSTFQMRAAGNLCLQYSCSSKSKNVSTFSWVRPLGRSKDVPVAVQTLNIFLRLLQNPYSEFFPVHSAVTENLFGMVFLFAICNARDRLPTLVRLKNWNFICKMYLTRSLSIWRNIVFFYFFF